MSVAYNTDHNKHRGQSQTFFESRHVMVRILPHLLQLRLFLYVLHQVMNLQHGITAQQIVQAWAVIPGPGHYHQQFVRSHAQVRIPLFIPTPAPFSDVLTHHQSVAHSIAGNHQAAQGARADLPLLRVQIHFHPLPRWRPSGMVLHVSHTDRHTHCSAQPADHTLYITRLRLQYTHAWNHTAVVIVIRVARDVVFRLTLAIP